MHGLNSYMRTLYMYVSGAQQSLIDIGNQRSYLYMYICIHVGLAANRASHNPRQICMLGTN